MHAQKLVSCRSAMSLIEIPTGDENNFQHIVFDFIERIAKEVSLFDQDSELNLSESAFRHIELQIQAQRIEKVLRLCISAIRSVFVVSQLIECQRDRLKLFFEPQDVECIGNLAQKWFGFEPNPLTTEFMAALNQCLDIAHRTNIASKIQLVISL